jgi:glycosyltransferase involved in cell wall biosynthesis
MDGGSNDGSVEYLDELYMQGRIHQFASEKDFGEGHGYNKAILRARGEIIKVISDDDAYDYNAIQFCKQFMLAHPDVQVLGADGFGVNNLLQINKFDRRFAIANYKVWKKNRTPFIFCGLSLILRKDAIPLIGLVNNNFIITDFEWTLRITAGKVKLGWYTGLLYVNILNQQSNSGTNWKRMEIEREKLEKLYLGKRTLISFQTKDKIKNIFRPIKYKLLTKKIIKPLSYEIIYQQSVQLLKETNKSIQHEVLV